MAPIWIGVAMGFGGTVAMDIWAWIAARLGLAGAPNWAMPGRWLAHVFRGRLFHDDIGAVAPVENELRLGWLFHYAVGLLYGVIFVLLAGRDWLAEPSFPPVWLFSLITILAGWCLLHPGMGLGWFASKTPSPWKTRILGLVAHTAFALGMWGVAVAL